MHTQPVNGLRHTSGPILLKCSRCYIHGILFRMAIIDCFEVAIQAKKGVHTNRRIYANLFYISSSIVCSWWVHFRRGRIGVLVDGQVGPYFCQNRLTSTLFMWLTYPQILFSLNFSFFESIYCNCSVMCSAMHKTGSS